VFGSWFLGP